MTRVLFCAACLALGVFLGSLAMGKAAGLAIERAFFVFIGGAIVGWRVLP